MLARLYSFKKGGKGGYCADPSVLRVPHCSFNLIYYCQAILLRHIIISQFSKCTRGLFVRVHVFNGSKILAMVQLDFHGYCSIVMRAFS
jgi:hypothetical protein